MRRGRLSALLLCLFALMSSAAVAQSAAPEAKPPVVLSPVVHPDRTVTFEIWAPLARQVQITGDFLILPNHSTEGVPMSRDEQGVWSYTSSPLSPDEYSYAFLVDGLRVLDPVNGRIRPGMRRQQSAFSIAGPEADYMAVKPVPHGEVRIVTLESLLEGKTRSMRLYLPPGYEKSRQRYPLLVLLHGGGEADFGWSEIGRVNFVLDNLIAAGKVKPMIVAMPSLGAVNPLTLPGAHEPDYALMAGVLEKEILPYCEQNYRLLPGSANRALGGLGVGRSMLPSLLWPTLSRFDWFAFAAGGTDPDVFADLQKRYAQALDRPENTHRVHFYLANGANDSSVTATRSFHEELKKRGYDSTLALDEGIHEWPSFRRHFATFAEWLFR